MWFSLSITILSGELNNSNILLESVQQTNRNKYTFAVGSGVPRDELENKIVYYYCHY